MNRKLRRRTTSKYKGVCWHKRSKKWIVRIGVNGNNITIGSYLTQEEAATEYNKMALKYYGEYAFLNKI